MYGEGISLEGELLDLGVENKVVEKSGAWFSFSGERLGQGRENSKTTLRENVDLRERVKAELRRGMGIGAPAAQAAGADE
jgi:recombination protein RecA